MSAAGDIRARYDDRHALAQGAIGCITAAVPIELILAAGLRPARLYGDPSRLPALGDRYMEEEVDGEVRSVFDLLLSGEAAGLPLVLLPRLSEQHLQLHYYLIEVAKWEPEAKLPPVEIVDVMQTAFWSTGRYVRARLDDLAIRLGGLGRRIDDDALRHAISTTNGQRRELRHLNALRRKGRIRASDLIRLAALFGHLRSEEFRALARALTAEAGPPLPGPRLMLSGSALDDPGLYDLIEGMGAHVAAEDHVAGERLYARLIDETMDPMEALTDHYQLHVPGLRQYPQAPQDARFLATCAEAAVAADLCVLEDCDDTLGWDWPTRRDALAQRGIPSLMLTGQRYFAPDRGAQRGAVEALLGQIAEAAR